MNSLSAHAHKKEIALWVLLLGLLAGVAYYSGLFLPYYTFDPEALGDVVKIHVLDENMMAWLFSWMISLAIVGTALFFFFKKSLHNAQKHNVPLLFNRPIKTLSWKFILILAVAPFCITVVSALTQWHLNIDVMMLYWELGIIIAVFIELYVRNIFIKYKFSLKSFLVVNTLLSVMFALLGFFSNAIGYFLILEIASLLVLNFFLGVLAYKSQRIELPMLFHLTLSFLLLGSYAISNYVASLSFFIIFIVLTYSILPLCALNSSHKRV